MRPRIRYYYAKLYIGLRKISAEQQGDPGGRGQAVGAYLTFPELFSKLMAHKRFPNHTRPYPLFVAQVHWQILNMDSLGYWAFIHQEDTVLFIKRFPF